MKDETFLLSKFDSVPNGPCSILRDIFWPGGRGWLVIENLTCTGSAKITVGAVTQHDTGLTNAMGMPVPALSAGGTSTITSPGIYPIDLPRCVIEFQFSSETGDEFLVEHAVLVRIP